MSNHLAIATVTAALGQLAYSAAQGAVGGVTLRFGRPVAPAAGTTERRVHVYLYQVTPNAALRNADLPTRNSDGRVGVRPQLALELHYLLTFYGDNQALEPDRMLGAVARDLHARPVLGAQLIADVIASHGTALAGSDLGAAVDRVRFTPATMTLDEQSKLWSVMVQTPHALSLACVASAVLLEALELATPAAPVLRRGEDDRGVDTRIGSLPRLDTAWTGFIEAAARQPRPPSLPAAALGRRLLIAGEHLGGDAVSLRLSHPQRPPLDLDIAPADRSAQDIRLTLPDDLAAQSAFAAGLYSVVARVRHGSGAQQTVRQSSVWPLLLAPRLASISPNPAASTGGAVTLTVVCRPQVQPAQQAVLVIADREVPADPHAAATDTLAFVLDPAPLGADQLVRLRVDGAESLPVRLDPVSGQYAFDPAQRVTVT